MICKKKIDQRAVFLSWVLLFICLSEISAQDSGLEKSITGINIGLTGFLSYEKRLTPTISSRVEVGLLYNRIESENLWLPYFVLQPRWYYNLNKRLEKSKNIRGNSGNYISALVLYTPETSSIFGNSSLIKAASFFVGPVWGLRRQLGTRFSFEFLAGLGLERTFYPTPENEIIGILNFNFGYNFIRRR